MPTNLTPANSWATPRGVSSGDAVDPTNTNEGYQANADRTEFIYQRCLNGGNPIWVEIPIFIESHLGLTIQNNVGSPHTAMFHIPLGQGFTSISGIRAGISPTGGHSAGEPTTPLSIQLVQQELSTDTDTVLQTLTGNQGTATNSYHLLSKTDFTETVDIDTYSYKIEFTGEAGTGAQLIVLKSLQVRISP